MIIALTGIGIMVTCCMVLVLLIVFGVAMEDAKQFPIAAITVSAAMVAAVWFLSDHQMGPREWIMRFVQDYRYRLLALVVAGVWVLIGMWWFSRGLSSHPYAMFYLFTGVLVLLWQMPPLLFLIALHTRYFRDMTAKLVQGTSTQEASIKLR